MEKKFSLSGKKCVSKPRQSRKRPGCIRLFVCPTTGGRLEISVSPRESILGLKTALARKLKTNPARITLIYKETALTSGRLVDYQIPEDSLLTLLPNMESGLSLHQSEKSITQALENLSETQVNDFLSGRAPLMLAIRMGENMVFVQLQLSTATQGQQQQQQVPPAQGGQPVAAAANPQLLGLGQQLQQRQHPHQQRPSSVVTPITQRTATLLSQRGLSASALAQATRCLSRRIHHLHGMGTSSSSSSSPSPSTTNHSTAVNPNLIPRMTVPMATSSSSLPPTSSNLSQSPAENMATTTTKPSIPTAGPSLSSPPSPPSSSSTKTPSLLQLPTSNLLAPPPQLQNLPASTSPLPSPPPSPGAVMNSFKHVGSGVYSGTFSGTLDSSLQEPNGQPRRSVHTILHILNDLLVASPASSPRPQPTSPTTPTTQTTRPPASPSTSHKSQQQQHQVFFNQNAILTPPPSPKQVDPNGSSFAMEEEKADNEILRGKMQRVQMMLAQRKELRGKRRQAVAPYSLQQVHNATPTDCFPSCPSDSTTDVAGGVSLSAPQQPSSSETAPSAPSTSATNPPASERPRICTHVEEGGECCTSYSKNGLEHDSLVV